MNKQVKERLAAAQAKVEEAKKAVANQSPVNSGDATPETKDESPKVDTPEVKTPETDTPEVEKAPEVKEVKKDKPKGKSFVVVSPFRDAADFNKTWEIGQDVSHFEKGRLEKCIKLKLVEQK